MLSYIKTAYLNKSRRLEMSGNKICVDSQVKAVVGLNHNRNPMFPDFNIPSGTCGIVKEVRTGQLTEDGFLFYVCWNVKGRRPYHYCCISSEISPI